MNPAASATALTRMLYNHRLVAAHLSECLRTDDLRAEAVSGHTPDEPVPPNLIPVLDPIDPDEVEAHLLAQPGVERIHDLHIWPMSTTEFALTAHLVIPGGFPGDDFLARCAREIEHRFGIGHSTLQVETGESCRQDGHS